MKQLELTKGFQTIIDDDDFDKVSQYKWYVNSDGYAVRNGYLNKKRVTVRLHRFIMNAGPDQLIDHVNKNRLDNRKSNLRFASKSENAINSKLSNRNSTGYSGVSRVKNSSKYRARIRVNSKEIYLGLFSTVQEASEAYNEAAKQYFGKFAR